MKRMIGFAIVLFCSTTTVAANELVSVTTNEVSEFGDVSPYGVAKGRQYIGCPQNICDLASGVITNGDHYFVYEYKIKSLQINYEYTNSVGESFVDQVNQFVCVQSNRAVIAMASLVSDENGISLFRGEVAIPDILVGDDKYACVNWLWLGSAYCGTSLGELGEHSFDQVTSIVLPDGCSVPSWSEVMYAYCNPYYFDATEKPIPVGFWNLRELAFGGKPDAFALSVVYGKSNPMDTMLSFADQINITEKYSAQWLKVLRNIGYGGKVHIIGSSITNRLNRVDGGLVSMTTTNVVIHYVSDVVQSAAVSPVTSETGFVNVITEIKGGNVAVPDSWAKNYPNFVSTFGSDFTAALMKPTKKKDGANNPMLVWQDYVAGTDPTKEDDVFKASITKDENGKIIISYTPEFKDENEKKKRKYTTLGKKSLMDATDWEVVPEGREADYNFFKVTVEMQSIQSK